MIETKPKRKKKKKLGVVVFVFFFFVDRKDKDWVLSENLLCNLRIKRLLRYLGGRDIYG